MAVHKLFSNANNDKNNVMPYKEAIGHFVITVGLMLIYAQWMSRGDKTQRLLQFEAK